MGVGPVPIRPSSLSGGQGWINTSPLDPFEVTVVRGGIAERWIVTDWGTEGPAAPSTWQVDQQRLIMIALLGEGWFVLNAMDDGSYSAFRITRDQWAETNTWDYARVHGDRLYVLQTDQTAPESTSTHLVDALGSVRPDQRFFLITPYLPSVRDWHSLACSEGWLLEVALLSGDPAWLPGWREPANVL